MEPSKGTSYMLQTGGAGDASHSQPGPPPDYSHQGARFPPTSSDQHVRQFGYNPDTGRFDDPNDAPPPYTPRPGNNWHESASRFYPYHGPARGTCQESQPVRSFPAFRRDGEEGQVMGVPTSLANFAKKAKGLFSKIKLQGRHVHVGNSVTGTYNGETLNDPRGEVGQTHSRGLPVVEEPLPVVVGKGTYTTRGLEGFVTTKYGDYRKYNNCRVVPKY